MKHILNIIMNKILIILILIIGLSSCSTIKYVPIQNDTVTNIKDSIVWHDSTIVNYITKERVVDIVSQYDTLLLETDYAKAMSYVDTTHHVLRGEIENKDTVPIKTEIKWKEKIIEKEVEVIKEVPVEVEVEKEIIPNWCWYSLIINVICGMLIGFKIYRKFSII